MKWENDVIKMKAGLPDRTPGHLTGTSPEPGSSASLKSSERRRRRKCWPSEKRNRRHQSRFKNGPREQWSAGRAIEVWMAGRPAFLSLGFLFCCCPPRTPAAPPDSAQEGPWSRGPPDSAQLLVAGHEVGNRSDEENRRPRPRLLRLAAACIATLPGPVLSGLRGRCLEELPSVQNRNQNHTRRVLTAGCACEFLGGLRVPPNGTACAQMLRGCGGGGVALAVGLSLLLLALVGGVGCVWRWKHRGRAPLALPGFLRPRRRRGDYSQTLSAGPPGLGAKAAAPDPRAGAADPQDPQGHYENLPARDPGAAHARGLYENAGRGACEEHVYGNQPAGDYYNLPAPGAPAAPPDEDIYILPDAY